MEELKILKHKEFGSIELVRRTGIRRLSVSIRPFRGVRVSMPPCMSYAQAERFVNEKHIWIRKQLSKIRSLEAARTVYRLNNQYETRYHSLHLQENGTGEFGFSISGGRVVVTYPAELETGSQVVQDWIRKAMEETWRKEAREYLPHRLKELADRHGFTYRRVFIRNNRTRWGSCSSTNNINLNLHLMRLPDDLIDYVLMHELIHTRQKNHGKEFWNELARYVPQPRQQDKRLHDYRLDVY